MDVEEVKDKLKSYSRDNIVFNEPHFTQQMILRDGNKEDVIDNILKPDRLAYVYSEGDKHNLYFEMSNTRTLLLPVIFHQKSLYIITYIMRYRKWQSMIK